MGLTQKGVYYFWTIEVRTGDEAGKVETQFLYFPLGQPDAVSTPRTVAAPIESDLAYEWLPETGLAAGPRVSLLDGPYPPASPITEPAMIAGQEAELALASRVVAQYQYRKMRGQVATLFLQDGRATGYQLLSFTANPSEAPFIASDPDQYLYVTWLERDVEGFRVYFASTAPDLVDALNQVSSDDVQRVGGEVLFGLLAGAVLSPFLVLLWLLFPLVVLWLTAVLRRENRGWYTRAGTVVSLGLAIAAYSSVKLLTLPGIRTYIPFSAWIPALPDWLQAPLQFAVPILVTMGGIAVAWHFTYRRQTRSPLYFMFIFAAVDGVLTMAVYGFLVYNVF